MSISVRARLLALVLVGGILPLALLGGWSTWRSVTTAERTVVTRLESVAERVVLEIETRWSFRRADLFLLAENEEVRLALTGGSVTDESALEFLELVYADLASAAPEVVIRDAGGRTRWRLSNANGDAVEPVAAGGFRTQGSPLLAVRIPVPGDDGAVGELEAHIRATSLMPPDTLQYGVPDAVLEVVHRPTGHMLTAAARATDLWRRESRFLLGNERWVLAHRNVAGPDLEVSVAAPVEPHLAPYLRAARLGLAALVTVALVLALLTTLLTRRITRGLERLAGASEAVAAGDLDARLPAGGSDEIGRTTAAFNAMTESLRKSVSELAEQRALAAVGQFAAGLAHEVRNGLTSVRVDLERTLAKLEGEDDAADLVSRALRQVDRIGATVTGSLQVARGARTRMDRLDVLETLRAAVDGAQAHAAAGRIELSGGNGSGPLSVRANDAALHQMFLNLLMNAVEAAPGSLVQVDIAASAEDVLVSIGDRGQGIPSDESAKIWEPFYTRKRGGTGLGLTIARDIARAHGGDVELAARPGGGTIASIRLPRLAPLAPSS